jgi:hypothetical protein
LFLGVVSDTGPCPHFQVQTTLSVTVDLADSFHWTAEVKEDIRSPARVRIEARIQPCGWNLASVEAHIILVSQQNQTPSES